jgi:hypothetical protein
LKILTSDSFVSLARNIFLSPIITSDSEQDVRKLCERVNKELEADGFGNRISPKVVRERGIPVESLADGLQLWGRPIQMSAQKVGLRRKFIVNYDTSGLSAAARARLFRALYGCHTKSTVKGKVYESKVDGIAAKPGVERFGTSTLMVEPELVDDVRSIVETAGAKARVQEVWV